MQWLKALGVMSGVLAGGILLADEPVSAPSRVPQLIDQLGHEEFAERENAGDELLKIGFPAYKQLEAATRNDDREISYRAARLLVRIREADLAEIKARLGSHRLVTLTGSGGVGKTRLAIEAGKAVLDRFTDGVWLAELAPLNDAQLVTSIIGETSRSLASRRYSTVAPRLNAVQTTR